MATYNPRYGGSEWRDPEGRPLPYRDASDVTGLLQRTGASPAELAGAIAPERARYFTEVALAAMMGKSGGKGRAGKSQPLASTSKGRGKVQRIPITPHEATVVRQMQQRREREARFDTAIEQAKEQARLAAIHQRVMANARPERVPLPQESTATLQQTGTRANPARVPLSGASAPRPSGAATPSSSWLGLIPEDLREAPSAPRQGRLSHWWDVFAKRGQAKAAGKAGKNVEIAETRLAAFDKKIEELSSQGKITADNPAVQARREPLQSSLDSAKAAQEAAKGKLQATEARIAAYADSSTSLAAEAERAARMSLSDQWRTLPRKGWLAAGIGAAVGGMSYTQSLSANDEKSKTAVEKTFNDQIDSLNTYEQTLGAVAQEVSRLDGRHSVDFPGLFNALDKAWARVDAAYSTEPPTERAIRAEQYDKRTAAVLAAAFDSSSPDRDGTPYAWNYWRDYTNQLAIAGRALPVATPPEPSKKENTDGR